MKKVLLAACAVAAVCVGPVVFAQGKDAKAEPAKVQPPVDWKGQVVRATGSGAPDMKASNPAQARLGAERAALADALRNLLQQVKGVSVDGTKKMGDLMEKDEVKMRVEGVVRGYKIVNKRYFSDSGVEVEIEVPLAMLSDIIDPDTTQMLAVGKPDGDKGNTGLVIDARGLNVTPSLMPRLLDDAGKPVYSIDSLSADARKATGVAAYVKSLEDANKLPKAGEKPLVIKAAKATGADLQLAPEDAKKLAALNTSFLADGKVVIVLN
ncbi:MAG: LPP20 family lipoprotein [Myxococcaceae bacterium]